LKNLIIRGGENIASLEVEAALCSLPNVSESPVFGIPDDRFGEIVGAVVTIKKGQEHNPQGIISSLNLTLAHFKIPSRMWIYPGTFPRTATQKVDMLKVKDFASRMAPDYQGDP
jgi:acyl-CoA synthetase (AMP-forming)/AMP-acid ligase II